MIKIDEFRKRLADMEKKTNEACPLSTAESNKAELTLSLKLTTKLVETMKSNLSKFNDKFEERMDRRDRKDLEQDE